MSSHRSAISAAEPELLNAQGLGATESYAQLLRQGAWGEGTPKPLIIRVNFPRLLSLRYGAKHTAPWLPALERGAAGVWTQLLAGNWDFTAMISKAEIIICVGVEVRANTQETRLQSLSLDRLFKVSIIFVSALLNKN